MIRLERNDKFKFNFAKHIGRIYQVIAFAPDASGTVYAVCQYQETDSAKPRLQLFSPADLNRFDGAFEMWNTMQRDRDDDLFERAAVVAAPDFVNISKEDPQ